MRIATLILLQFLSEVDAESSDMTGSEIMVPLGGRLSIHFSPLHILLTIRITFQKRHHERSSLSHISNNTPRGPEFKHGLHFDFRNVTKLDRTVC